MRLEGPENGKLRIEVQAGVWYARMCFCPGCGSANTVSRSGGKGVPSVGCRGCGHRFKAPRFRPGR